MSAPSSISELVETQAARQADRVLFEFVGHGERWTFADLAARAAVAGAALARGGVGAGARVGILTDDRRAFCDALFGLERVGAVPVPLGAGGHPGSEGWLALLRDRVRRFGLDAIVTDPPGRAPLAEALSPGPPVLAVDGRPDARRTAGDAMPARPGPVAFVQPSSGTTGEPKGVVLEQRAVLAALAAMQAAWGFAEHDRGLSWLPLFHDMGLVGTVLLPLWVGASMHHWSTEGFLRSPGRWLALVEEQRIGHVVAPPFALELLTRRWRRRPVPVDLRTLTGVLVGAERIRAEVLEAFAATFAEHGLVRSAIIPTYGLAEATLAVSAKPRGTAFRVVHDGLHRHVSCGPPIPGVRVRVDAVTGELEVQTPSAMRGYLDDPEATAAAFTPDGWLRTGDAARLDRGEVVVVGRLKEMVNRNGARIAASDFELAASGVEGVLPDRVVAFGDAGPDGERVVLLAETRWRAPRTGELVLALRARLADAGLPADVVELVPPGFIPRTTSGKLRRAAARDAWRLRHERAPG